MTIKLGPMDLLATEPTDVIEDYVNGLQPDGGEWTNWSRLSGHDHSGGLLGVPVAVNIPPGTITADMLAPSVLEPYALTDGSRPFTGQVEMDADAVIRDTLYFGEQGTALAPDVTLARTAPGALRVDNHLGIGAAAPADTNPAWKLARIGPSGALLGTDIPSLFVTSNSYQVAGGWRPLVGGKAGAMFQLSENGLTYYFLPSVAAGAAQTPKAQAFIAPTGTLTVTPDAGATGLVVGNSILVKHPTPGSEAALFLESPSGNANLLWQIGGANRWGIFGGVAGWQLYEYASGTARFNVIGGGAADRGTVIFYPGTAGAQLWVQPGGSSNSRLATGLGNLELAPQAGYVHPSTDNVFLFGAPSSRWSVMYATSGVVSGSSRTAKQDITPLDPAAAMAAVRATEAVTFTYRAPAEPPRRKPPGGRFDWKAERDRLIARPLVAAARSQAGFTTEQADPLFVTGEGQANPSNTAGVLLAALKDVDTRLTALEEGTA